MICSTCGQENDEQKGFCSRCGAPTVAQQAPPPAVSPPQTAQPQQPAAPAPPPAQSAPQAGVGQAAPPPPPGMQSQAPPPPPPAGGPVEGIAPRPETSPQGNVQYAPQGAQPQQAPPTVPPPVMQPGHTQPTTQMPVQQVPQQGAYQQQPYGQGAYQQQGYYAQQGQYAQQGPYAQQAPYAPQAQQFRPAPPAGTPYGQPYAAAGRTGKRGSTVAGLLTLLAGAAVIGSTFLPWVSMSAMGYSASVSGYNYMTGSLSGLGGGEFSLVLTGDGIVFFTGFFSLLLGVLILAGGLVMLFRRRIGGVFTFIVALLATGVAAVDTAMIMTKMTGGSAAVGMWMFVGAAVLALVMGIVGLASSG